MVRIDDRQRGFENRFLRIRHGRVLLHCQRSRRSQPTSSPTMSGEWRAATPAPAVTRRHARPGDRSSHRRPARLLPPPPDCSSAGIKLRPPTRGCPGVGAGVPPRPRQLETGDVIAPHCCAYFASFKPFLNSSTRLRVVGDDPVHAQLDELLPDLRGVRGPGHDLDPGRVQSGDVLGGEPLANSGRRCRRGRAWRARRAAPSWPILDQERKRIVSGRQLLGRLERAVVERLEDETVVQPVPPDRLQHEAREGLERRGVLPDALPRS